MRIKTARQARFLCYIIMFMQLMFTTNVFAQTGIFWQATSPDAKPIYLFGTIHSDDNRVSGFTGVTLNAIAESDVFMLEVEQPDTPEPLLTRRKLSEDLTEAQMDQVNQLADQYVLPREFAMQMKPWLLALIFDAAKPQTPFGQDHLLRAEADKVGKRVIALETAEAHFGVLDDIARPAQLSLLTAVLKRSQAEKEKDYEKVIAAYLQGDLDKILATNAQTTGDLVDDALWQKIKARLIEQRNLTMVKRITSLSKDNSLFVAVGASHLAGETGLVKLLVAAGFKLSPMVGLTIPE